jgi:hypothetical protein
MWVDEIVDVNKLEVIAERDKKETDEKPETWPRLITRKLHLFNQVKIGSDDGRPFIVYLVDGNQVTGSSNSEIYGRVWTKTGTVQSNVVIKVPERLTNTFEDLYKDVDFPWVRNMIITDYSNR